MDWAINFWWAVGRLVAKNECVRSHPSPIVRCNFIECHHFSQANTYLTSHGRKPVDWSL